MEFFLLDLGYDLVSSVGSTAFSSAIVGSAEGEKIPRKGGPGITRSDLLVINKIDLAPLVGANLGIMESDTVRMRSNRPFVFSNLKSGIGVEAIANFIIEKGGLAKNAA